MLYNETLPNAQMTGSKQGRGKGEGRGRKGRGRRGRQKEKWREERKNARGKVGVLQITSYNG